MNDVELDLREKLAAIEHERWSDWQAWCHKIIRENDAKGLSVEDVLERWDRQIATPYEKLSDAEKASDIEQVDRYWPLIQDYLAQEKANLQAALEAELPKKYPNLRRDNYYERGQNIAIDKCAEAIAAVFNKEGR